MSKLDLGITNMHPNKSRTLQEYIEYRNEIYSKAITRTAKFKDNGFNYYWLRLKELDLQYPQFTGMGRIKLK